MNLRYRELTQKDRKKKMHDIAWKRPYPDGTDRPDMEEFVSDYISDEALNWYPGCKKLYRPVKFRWGPKDPTLPRDRGAFQAYFESNGGPSGWHNISYNKIAERISIEKFWERKIKEFFRDLFVRIQPEHTLCAFRSIYCIGIGQECHHLSTTFDSIIDNIVRPLITQPEIDSWKFWEGSWGLSNNHPAVKKYYEIESMTQKIWICKPCHYEAHGKKQPKKKAIPDRPTGLVSYDLFEELP